MASRRHAVHCRFGRGRGKGIAPRFIAVFCTDCGMGWVELVMRNAIGSAETDLLTAGDF